MPKVVSTVFLSEAYCCRYMVAISPNSKVLTSDTGSSSYASIDGYCLNGTVFNDAEIDARSAFNDAEIDAGSVFRALVVSAEFSFIVDNNASASLKALPASISASLKTVPFKQYPSIEAFFVIEVVIFHF